MVSRNLWDLQGRLIAEKSRNMGVHTRPLAFVPPILKPDIFDMGLVVKCEIMGYPAL